MSLSATTTPFMGLRLDRIYKTILKYTPDALSALVFSADLYFVVLLYAANEIVFALISLVVLSLSAYVFWNSRTYSLRYIVPALVALFLFIILPTAFTVVISFTNTSGLNLLSQQQAESFLLERTYMDDGNKWRFSLVKSSGGHRLLLKSEDGTQQLISPEIDLSATSDAPVKLVSREAGTEVPEPAPFRAVIQARAALSKLKLLTPEGNELSMSGLREFAPLRPLFEKLPDGTLQDKQTSIIYAPDFEKGFYTSQSGQTISPGFQTFIGWDNYMRIFFNAGIWESFLQIFAWTVIFAGLTVLFTFIVGVTLAYILQWDRIAGRGTYRLALMLPYAIPAFISILVFRGLFNQEFGEINLILQQLFGLKPEWFTDPLLAKMMLLLVNTWLGYPYIMILAMGIMQSISNDLYQASAVEGAKPYHNFFRITVPMILPPFLPLLIASFAFNFNNFVLITLLTGGRPDIIGASVPAGTTDILVSFTYRIAFQNSAQDFGLASAISTIIFMIVGAIAVVNLWAMQRKETNAANMRGAH